MKKREKTLTIVLIMILNIMIIKQDISAREPSANLFPVDMGMKGKVITSGVNVRTRPDISSKVTGQKNNTDIMVTGQYKDWYQIKDDQTQAWINKQYVSVQNSDYIPEIPLLGEQIVDYGKQFIGTPYVWGGNSLNSGVDCSGFTQKIYEKFDINISRTSSMQAVNGKPIAKNELKSGDLIFFDTNGVNKGRISHVGVYAGNGEFIHSSSSRGISVSSLENAYYKRNYVKSVRLPGI